MRELIIADGTTPEILGLLQGARIPAIALCPTSDPLNAITRALEGKNVVTLHIVAHGNNEGFSIGGQWIDRERLQDAGPILKSWNVARIALWSCRSGNDIGFPGLLAKLSGAEVFASSKSLGLDLVSNERIWTFSDLGGSIELNAFHIVSAETLENWDYQPVTITPQGICQTTASEPSGVVVSEQAPHIAISTTPLSTSQIKSAKKVMRYNTTCREPSHTFPAMAVWLP